MGDLAEDRVYDAGGAVTEVFVAAGIGVVRVEASGDRIGGYGIDHRCVARDVAADGRVVVATDEEVLLRENGEFVTTGFGPAVAVGFYRGRPVGATESGRVATRYEDEGWVDVDILDADVRAIDGDLLATDEGVYRLAAGEYERLGLTDVRDVAGDGELLAATDDGLYAFDGGWTRVRDGDLRSVAVAPGGVAHAATPEALYERRENEWEPIDLPVREAVVGVAYGDCPYAVTEAGTLLTGDDEWRPHPLGVGDVVGIAVR